MDIELEITISEHYSRTSEKKLILTPGLDNKNVIIKIQTPQGFESVSVNLEDTRRALAKIAL